MLCFLERLSAFNDLKSEISNLKSEVEGISRQLRAWADSLQNSEIKGQRYLNEKEQILAKDKKEKAEFLKTLKSYQKAK
jgi:chromosome segregation ATPase